jgi:protein SCO1/2
MLKNITRQRLQASTWATSAPQAAAASLVTVAFAAIAGLGNAVAAMPEAPMAGHEQHQAAANNKNLKISAVDYKTPDVMLVRDDGKKVAIVKELDDGRPVLMNFIYTTCPGICPIMSQTFSQLQDRLGADKAKVHMISVSIDPEEDTPPRLREYAKKFSAGPQWQHYTGTVAASVAIQKAFNAYRGDKMNHDPLTLMRAAPGKPWVRVDGFASAADLLVQYQAMTAAAAKTAAAN